MTIDPTSGFIFTSNLISCDVIDEAFVRYHHWIQLDRNGIPSPDLSPLQQLSVSVVDLNCSSYPALGDDESYSLTINGQPTATLQAKTVWGALRGLETFSQLIYLTDDKKYCINYTSITDFPRFGHRGLMIDTARHFYPVNTIINILDAMSWDKFNVLHWHIVDDQSFPYQSTTFPNLSTQGAYTPYHVYSQENVTRVIAEARLRGIRVIPEFDTPGHTWSWGKAFPSLLTPCWGNGTAGGPNVPNYPIHGPREILNPILDSTYEFLESLYAEIAEKFPDSFVHLGMDEVYYDCWESNPNITEWMRVNNLTDIKQVEEYYIRRLLDIVGRLQKPLKNIIWQEPVDNNVAVNNKDTVVEIWKDKSNNAPGQFETWHGYALATAVKNYTMILSAPWYLNFISYGQDWKNYYQVEPTNFTDNATLQQLMKGGEACAWSEYLDSSNILSVLWPRASAVAERLWSAKNVTDVNTAQYRLDQQRCRMIRRGIPAKPILNGYCGDYEWDFPVEYSGGINHNLHPIIHQFSHAILSHASIRVVLVSTAIAVLALRFA